jgi:hypothetical protein
MKQSTASISFCLSSLVARRAAAQASGGGAAAGGGCVRERGCGSMPSTD